MVTLKAPPPTSGRPPHSCFTWVMYNEHPPAQMSLSPLGRGPPYSNLTCAGTPRRGVEGRVDRVVIVINMREDRFRALRYFVITHI